MSRRHFSARAEGSTTIAGSDRSGAAHAITAITEMVIDEQPYAANELRSMARSPDMLPAPALKFTRSRQRPRKRQAVTAKIRMRIMKFKELNMLILIFKHYGQFHR
jgi:hypothetical protein